MNQRIAHVGLMAAFMLAGCGRKTDAGGFTLDPAFEKNLETRLLDAKPGEVIDVPAGKYRLTRSLSLAAFRVLRPSLRIRESALPLVLQFLAFLQQSPTHIVGVFAAVLRVQQGQAFLLGMRAR